MPRRPHARLRAHLSFFRVPRVLVQQIRICLGKSLSPGQGRSTQLRCLETYELAGRSGAESDYIVLSRRKSIRFDSSLGRSLPSDGDAQRLLRMTAGSNVTFLRGSSCACSGGEAREYIGLIGCRFESCIRLCELAQLAEQWAKIPLRWFPGISCKCCNEVASATVV